MPLRLWLYDKLAFHPAVADPATIATVEGVSPRRARHKFHHGRNSLFELEAVITRTEDEACIALFVRSIRAEIDLEAVGPVDSRDPELHFGAAFYADRCWTVLILLCGHLNDLYFLVRLRSIRQPGKAGGDGESAQQEQRRNAKYATQFYSSMRIGTNSVD